MYENGMRKNRYSNKRHHIDAQKKKFLSGLWRSSTIGMSYEQYLATRSDEEREYRTRAYKQGGLPACEQYWSTCYVSGPRGFAKDMTSSILRSDWRNMKNALLLLEDDEFDDVDYDIGNNSDYQKHFDYTWTIW